MSSNELPEISQLPAIEEFFFLACEAEIKRITALPAFTQDGIRVFYQENTRYVFCHRVGNKTLVEVRSASVWLGVAKKT
jgi:hypothetical protein